MLKLSDYLTLFQKSFSPYVQTGVSMPPDLIDHFSVMVTEDAGFLGLIMGANPIGSSDIDLDDVALYESELRPWLEHDQFDAIAMRYGIEPQTLAANVALLESQMLLWHAQKAAADELHMLEGVDSEFVLPSEEIEQLVDSVVEMIRSEGGLTETVLAHVNKYIEGLGGGSKSEVVGGMFDWDEIEAHLNDKGDE